MELAAAPPESWVRAGDEQPEPSTEGAEGGAPREIVVRYRDAAAGDVRIAGDFNGWVPDKDVRSLVQAEGPDRVWTKILHVPPGTYQYRYVVDGEWREDPDNPQIETTSVGGRSSVLVVR